MSGVNPAIGTMALLYQLFKNYNPNGETRVGPQQAMPSPNGVGVNVELGRGNFPGQAPQGQLAQGGIPMEPIQGQLAQGGSPMERIQGQPEQENAYQSIMNSMMGGGQEQVIAELLAKYPGLMRGGM